MEPAAGTRRSARLFDALPDFLCIPPQTGAWVAPMMITFELPEPARVPHCGACRCAMHVARIEWETERIDRYIFDCRSCDAIETRSVIAQ